MPNDKIILNRAVALDVMWLDGKATVHVVDVDTHFISASFFTSHRVDKIWESFLECWTTLYTDFQTKVKVDQVVHSLQYDGQGYVTR